MKLIVAVVRPFKLDEIVTVLETVEGFTGMTVVDSEGFGQRLLSAAADALDPFKPNKRIEIVSSDDAVNEIVAAIKNAAHTGKKGDGLISVLPLDSVVLI